ncbi:MAG: hypothetical protein ACF8Q5_13785 [Phycisphaerales bacterium JB040]
MGQVKPWQIVLIVVAVVVCGVSVGMTMFGGEPIALGDRIEMADVVTGDRYWIDVSGNRRGTFPAKHPETGMRTLVRIHEQEDGTWSSDEIGAAAGMLEGSGKDPRELFEAVESFQNGTIRVSQADPKKYVPGG